MPSAAVDLEPTVAKTSTPKTTLSTPRSRTSSRYRSAGPPPCSRFSDIAALGALRGGRGARPRGAPRPLIARVRRRPRRGALTPRADDGRRSRTGWRRGVSRESAPVGDGVWTDRGRARRWTPSLSLTELVVRETWGRALALEAEVWGQGRAKGSGPRVGPKWPSPSGLIRERRVEAQDLAARRRQLGPPLRAVGHAQWPRTLAHIVARGRELLVPAAPADLDGSRSITFSNCHVRHRDLDPGDLGGRRLVADGVHEMRGVQHVLAAHVDLDARLCDPVLDEALPRDERPEGAALSAGRP